ncbi:MAG: acyltransferase [Candidatus Methylumidiphilus sp.]
MVSLAKRCCDICSHRVRILIKDEMWIGAGAVLLEGAVLRRGCVIGAMPLVRGEVPAYSIQAGNPLRLLGWRA